MRLYCVCGCAHTPWRTYWVDGGPRHCFGISRSTARAVRLRPARRGAQQRARGVAPIPIVLDASLPDAADGLSVRALPPGAFTRPQHSPQWSMFMRCCVGVGRALSDAFLSAVSLAGHGGRRVRGGRGAEAAAQFATATLTRRRSGNIIMRSDDDIGLSVRPFQGSTTCSESLMAVLNREHLLKGECLNKIRINKT